MTTTVKALHDIMRTRLSMQDRGITNPNPDIRRITQQLVEKLGNLEPDEVIEIKTHVGQAFAQYIRVLTGEVLAEIIETSASSTEHNSQEVLSIIFTKLESAYRDEDEDEVEATLFECFRIGLDSRMEPALILLCGAPWHSRHEDVVRALQEIGSTSAVAALEKATHEQHDYLSYDKHFGFARKCIWALADIGSIEAYSALEKIADSPNTFIAEYAKKRLEQWEIELPRKRQGIH